MEALVSLDNGLPLLSVRRGDAEKVITDARRVTRKKCLVTRECRSGNQNSNHSEPT